MIRTTTKSSDSLMEMEILMAAIIAKATTGNDRRFRRIEFKAGDTFQLSSADKSRYRVQENGSFVRLNKDRRSVKERKRARRAERTASHEA